jgi:hypothetical protein
LAKRLKRSETLVVAVVVAAAVACDARFTLRRVVYALSDTAFAPIAARTSDLRAMPLPRPMPHPQLFAGRTPLRPIPHPQLLVKLDLETFFDFAVGRTIVRGCMNSFMNNS